MWHPSSSLQTDNALCNLSGRISLTTSALPGSQKFCGTLPGKGIAIWPARLQHQSWKSIPLSHSNTLLKPKTNYCSQLNAFKKQIQS